MTDREKSINEMASAILEGIRPLKETYGTDEIAAILYDAGYRKQKHGRWRKDNTCSACGAETISFTWDEPDYDYNYDDELEYVGTITRERHVLTQYCPHCGAKMEGNDVCVREK